MEIILRQLEKPIARLFVLPVIAIFICNLNINAQSVRDSLTCLEISGKIKKLKNTDSQFYKVELIKDTSIVDSMILGGKSKFRFFLEKNSYYGIRITKPGYLPRLISICTEIPKGKKFDRFYRFHFDTELIEDAEYLNLDHDALDFPIALVLFDKKMKCFYYSEDYTSAIKKKLYMGVTASN